MSETVYSKVDYSLRNVRRTIVNVVNFAKDNPQDKNIPREFAAFNLAGCEILIAILSGNAVEPGFSQLDPKSKNGLSKLI